MVLVHSLFVATHVAQSVNADTCVARDRVGKEFEEFRGTADVALLETTTLHLECMGAMVVGGEARCLYQREQCLGTASGGEMCSHVEKGDYLMLAVV